MKRSVKLLMWLTMVTMWMGYTLYVSRPVWPVIT